MSDMGRQSVGDKAAAALKPDSQKSTTEHIGDKLTGKADSAGSTMQPQSEKSTTQKISDTVSGNSNNNDATLLDKAKSAVGMDTNKAASNTGTGSGL